MSTSKAQYATNHHMLPSYATNQLPTKCTTLASVIDIYQKIHGKDVPATTLAPEVRSRNTFA